MQSCYIHWAGEKGAKSSLPVMAHGGTLCNSVWKTVVPSDVLHCALSIQSLYNYSHRHRRRGRQRGHAPPPHKKKSGKYFSSNYYVKFWHFVTFSYVFFGQKCISPLKLTELLRLWLQYNIHIFIHHNGRTVATVASNYTTIHLQDISAIGVYVFNYLLALCSQKSSIFLFPDYLN